VDGRGLIGSWFRFLWNLVRSSIEMSTKADGVVDLMVGLFVLAIVATIVVLPLLIITFFWIISRFVQMLRSVPSTIPTAGWQPTHSAPAGGMRAWASPDSSTPPVTSLNERLDLTVDRRSGDWALVRASNGWSGWVDARRLVPRS
jgi:hypothetical protein